MLKQLNSQCSLSLFCIWLYSMADPCFLLILLFSDDDLGHVYNGTLILRRLWRVLWETYSRRGVLPRGIHIHIHTRIYTNIYPHARLYMCVYYIGVYLKGKHLDLKHLDFG
jgi:hypothetical protein